MRCAVAIKPCIPCTGVRGLEAELFSTPAVSVHGLAAPVSNPPLTIRFDAPPPVGLIVSEIVVV